MMERKFTRGMAVLLCLVMFFQTIGGELGITAYASQTQMDEIDVSNVDNEDVVSSNDTNQTEDGDMDNSGEDNAEDEEEGPEAEKVTDDRFIQLECTDFSSESVKLKWQISELADVSSFGMFRDGVSVDDTIPASENTEYDWTDTNVENNASYTYLVKAYDKDNNVLGTSEEVLVEVTDDWVITQNTVLAENKTVKNLIINNWACLNLGSCELKVLGDVKISTGYITVNKGYLECEDLLIDNYGYMNMDDPNGYVLVRNDMYYNTRNPSNMSEGTLEIKGDYTYGPNYAGGFVCSNNHITIFSGEEKQTISIKDDNNTSRFNIVEVNNNSKDGIVCNGIVSAYDFRTNGCRVDFGIEGGKSGWTLSEDVTIKGDLILTSDTMNLNGHKLTVTGNIIQIGGAMKINGGSLLVEGDYYIEYKKSENGEDIYKKSSGRLVMTNPEDYVTVLGSFETGSVFSHAPYLTNGTLEVKKNFIQKSYNNEYSFSTSGDFKLLLSGDGEQKVDFARNNSNSSIANLEITNSSEGVVFGSNNLTVTKSINDHGNKTSGYIALSPGCNVIGNRFEGNIYIRENTTLSQELTIGGNLLESSYLYINNDLTIEGDYTINGGGMYLYGHTMSVKGNVNFYYGYLRLDGGRCECQGNVTQFSNSWNSCGFWMVNDNDYVYIAGNYFAEHYSPYSMEKGTMEIKGDFTQKTDRNSSNFVATGTHKVILSGEKKQTVTFDSNLSTFNKLILDNHSEEGIYAPNGLNAVEIVWNGCKVDDGKGGTIGYTLDKDTVIDTDFYLTNGEMDLNGYKLTVKGNLIQSGGTMKINGGSLEVEGNYFIQTEKKSEDGEKTYIVSNGTLYMTNEADYILVHGDFTMGANVSESGRLTTGTLEVKGNVTQQVYASEYNFATSGKFKLLLSGDGEQQVNFGRNNCNSCIANLEITNESENGIVIGGNNLTVSNTLDDHGNKSSGYIVLLSSSKVINNRFEGNIYIRENTTLDQEITIGGNLSESNYFYIKNNLTIEGDYTINGGGMYLNGHTMSVKGNVNFYYGYLRLDGGRCECQGNVTQFSNSWNSCGFWMVNDNDYVYIAGNYFAEHYNPYPMEKGTMEIKGDFTQKTDRNSSNFVATGTHKVILSGEKKQTVTFDSNLSTFNKLILDNHSEEGIYAPNGLNAVEIVWNGCKVDDGKGGTIGYTLDKDTVIDTDLYLTNGEMDLNGYKLTVKGSLIQSGGTMKINGGSLEVKGNYFIQTEKKSEDGEKTYIVSNGALFMTNEADHVLVHGDFTMGANVSERGRLTAGTLEVKGNVTQQIYASEYNFSTSDSFKLLLSGNGEQQVNFGRNNCNSCIANLEITNESENGIVIGGNNLTVSNSLDDHGNKSSGYIVILSSCNVINNRFEGNIYIRENTTLGQELTIGGNLSQSNNLYLNYNFTVEGDHTINGGGVYANGHTMSVKGNLNFYYGYLRLDGGRCECQGNVTQFSNSWNSCGFWMVNDNDYVYIAGNYFAEHYNPYPMEKGTMEIKGDFTQKTDRNSSNFIATGTHKVILSGEKKQTVSFDSSESTFQILELKNDSKDGVYFNSAVINAREFIQNDTIIHMNNIGILGKKLTEDTVIDDDVYLVAGDLDLNGYKLKISGNLYVGGGSVILNGGTLEVGKDMRYQTLKFNEDNSIASYGNSTAYLVMVNENDKVVVGGDFIMQSLQSHYGKLTNGTLELKGNFEQVNCSSVNFQTTGEFHVVLSGDKKQTVKLSYPQNSTFTNLEVMNTSASGVVLLNNIYVNGKLSDPNNKITKDYTAYIPDINCLESDKYGGSICITGTSTLKKDIAVAGCLTIGNNYNLNGFTLSSGNATINNGTTQINGGKFFVTGNLLVDNSGVLEMKNANDYICVSGAFTMNTYNSQTGRMTAGTLEVRGDFIQNARTQDNFVPTGDHTTVLSGKAGIANRNYVQVVKFANPGFSKFNHLVLNKALKYYSFSSPIEQLCNDYVNESKDIEAPDAVTDVVVTDTTATKVTLNWSSVSDNNAVTGYEVYRGESKVGTTSKTSFTDSGLVPNTTYVYKVFAFDEMRNVSKASNQVRATTLKDTQAPTVPNALKVKTKTGSAVTITWNSSTDDVGVAGYKVIRDGKEIATLGCVTSYKDEDCKQDTLYSYQVKAFDATGNESPLSNEIKGSVAMPEIVSYSPKENTAIGGGRTTIQVYYTNVGNSTGNKVKFEYQTTDGEGNEIWEQIGGVLYGQQNYSASLHYSRCVWDYNDVMNGECKMRITLYDADGNEDKEEFSYFIDTKGPKPTDELKAVPKDGTVILTWSESDSADTNSYKVYRSASEKGKYTYLATVKTNAYTDTSVVAEKTYYYRISGVDNFNQEGDLSEAVGVKVTADQEPPKVTGISAKDCRINKTAAITVTGTDNIGVAKLILEYEDKKSGEWIGIDGTEKQAENGSAVFNFDTTESVDGVKKFEDGTYRLRAFAVDLSGNRSDDTVGEIAGNPIKADPFYADVTIDNTGISKIHVKEATGYPTYVTLKWDNVPEDDFSYFTVEQFKNNGFVRVATTNTELGAHIQNLETNREYRFRVVGYDDLGNRGIASDEVTVSTTSDDQAPIIRTFAPANKYFNSSIPLSLDVTDNVGVASLRLQYSTDHQNYIDLTTITCDSIEKSHTFHYDLAVGEIPEGNVYIRAFALDEAGNESGCNGVPVENFFIVDRTAPGKVMNVKAEGMSGYNTITWDRPVEEDLKEFQIYRAEEEIGNYTLLATGITTNTYYDTTAVYGTVYVYKVKVIDQAGNVSEFSSEAVAQSHMDDEAPVVHAVTPSDKETITGNVQITAVVTDNVTVKDVSFEYKPKDSKEDIWSELDKVTVGETCGYPTVSWDVSKFENKDYELRITATDQDNNISNPYVVTYTVDTMAPEAPEINAVAEGFAAKLSWEENSEEDFDYYEVYRRMGNEDKFKLLKQITGNEYEDTSLKAGRKYVYKIYVYDKAGNHAESKECVVVPTDEDKEAPVAVTSENLSVRVGSEVLLDATASHDNVKITSYVWDMGNGDKVKGAIAKYTYSQMGTYKAKLTVKDAAGNSDSTVITIRVRSRISAKVDLKVISQSGDTKFSMGYSYIYIEDMDHIGTNYMADCYGELSVVLNPGTYNVEAYKEGFMPKAFTLHVANGDEQSMVLILEKGELVTGKLTATRLTLKEILELGVDIQDPSNWYTYYYTMNFTEPDSPVIHTQKVELKPGKVTKVTTGGGSGGSYGSGGGSYYVGMVDVKGKKVVTVYRCISYLKKMYDVELQVTNNAEAGYGFDIIDSTATLNLPSGLSLLKINRPQSLTNEIGTLEAQKTADTHWYIKADEPGNYDLSATFNGTLMPFEAPVETVIKADEPLVVTKEEDNTFTDPGFAQNPTDYVIRVEDKQGARIKGAIVTLSDGEHQCQTITNNRGTARLEVNPNDAREFTLTISHDEFVECYEPNRYKIKTPSYFDTIKLYRPGESRIEDDEKEEEDVDNPYLDGYAIGIQTATFDSYNLINKTRVWNRAEKKSHNFYFQFTNSVQSYELTLNGKQIQSGKNSSDVLQFSVNPDVVKEDGVFGLNVYGEKDSASYTLKLRSEVNLYDAVMMNYGTDHTDLLTETYTVYTYYKGTKFTITSNLLKNTDFAVSRFALVQEEDEIASSKDGKFELKVDDFKPNTKVYIYAYDNNDEILSKEYLYLCVQKSPELPDDFKLSFASGDKISFTVPDGAPFFGGMEMNLDISDIELPYDLEYTSEGCKISVGKSIDGEKEKGKNDIWIIPDKLKLTMGVTGSLYGNYDATKWEGGLQFKLGIEGEWAQQAAVGPVPVVIEVTASGEVTADGTLALDLTPEAKERLTGAISLLVEVGLELYAGIGVADVASAGIYGAVTFGLGFDLLPKAGMSQAYVNGEAGVKAEVLCFEYKKAILKGTYWLYNKDPNAEAENALAETHSLDEISADLAEIQNYHLMARPEDDTTTWYGNSVSDESNTVQTLQSGVHGSSDPKFVTAGDKALLIFNDDNTSQNIANGSKVVYSVYQDGKFSAPVCVGDANHAQYAFDAYEENGEVYLIWQEANKEFEEDASLEVMAESMELTAAKYDSQTDTFTSLGPVTADNEIFESNPQICSVGGKVYATWSENSENDIFGKNGTSTLKKAVCNGESWSSSEVASGLANITSMDAGKMSDGASVAYTQNGSSTVANLENEGTENLPSGTANVNYGYFKKEPVLTWYNGGVVQYETGLNGEKKALFDDVAIRSNAYSYVSDAAGNSSIIYSMTSDGKAQVYVSDYDTDQNIWGSPQAVTDQDAYLENASGTYYNGQLLLCFNKTVATFTDTGKDDDWGTTSSDLSYMKVGKEAKLVINDITYDNAQVIPFGDVELGISVSNNGLESVKGSDISISIRDENGKEKANANGTADIRAGQNATESVNLKLPSALSASTYTAVVTYHDISVEKEFAIGFADLSVSAKAYLQEDRCEVEAIVKNTGVEAANGKVIIYDYYDRDAVKNGEKAPIKELAFDALNYDEEQVLTFIIPKEIYDENNGISLAVEVITDQEEASKDNNLTVVYLGQLKDAKPCRVTFDYANPGYQPVKKFIASGNNITFPEEPAVSGYTFLGWYDGDTRYTEENKVFDDLRLVAKYQKNPEVADPTDPAEPPKDAPKDTPKDEPKKEEPKTQEKKLLKKNAKETVDGITYKVVKSSKTKGTVTVYKIKNTKLTTVTIPDSLKIKGYKYKVISIGKNAFKNDKKLKKVIIGKYVTSIGSNAFSGCKNLKTIQINSKSITTVGKNAFKNIYKKAAIKVPSSKLKKYKKLFDGKGQKKTVVIKKK